MFLLKEFQKRIQIIRDSSKSREKRVFALLELIFAPLSFCTIFIFLPVMILLTRKNCLEPETLGMLNAFLRVLLAASVGYLTNFIALEMIFKPFHPSKKHVLSLLTLGFWKQGLVPKNKDQLGFEIGRQVEEKLLDPQTIAGDLTAAAVEFLQKPETMSGFRQGAGRILNEHKNQIADFLLPHVENSLAECVRGLLTSKNIKELSQKMFVPLLESEKTRETIASKIAAGLKSQAPQFMETLRVMVHEYVESFLQKNPLLGSFGLAGSLASGFVSFVNWSEVQEKIEQKLSDPEIVKFLGDEMANLGEEGKKWLDSPDSLDSLEKFRSELQEHLRVFLKEYLELQMPLWLTQIQESPELWQWVDAEVMPNARKMLEIWVQADGKKMIVEKLHLSKRIQEAVQKQDVEEFYLMITNVAAQQLGAIQVPGFFLGGIVGLIQLLL